MSYPGKGDAWVDFLHHRARVLIMWEREGKTPAESAQMMSMDPVQVRLILESCRSSAEFADDAEEEPTAPGEGKRQR